MLRILRFISSPNQLPLTKTIDETPLDCQNCHKMSCIKILYIYRNIMTSFVMGALSVLMIYVIYIPIPKQYILIKHKMYISAMEKTDVFIICCLLKQESGSQQLTSYSAVTLIYFSSFESIVYICTYIALHISELNKSYLSQT